MTAPQQGDRSTMQLLGDVVDDIRTLMRQEVALARAEIRQELRQVLEAALVFAAAAALLGVAGLWVLVGVTRGIAYLFNWRLGAVYVGVGAALGLFGLVLLAIVWELARDIKVLPMTKEILANRGRSRADR